MAVIEELNEVSDFIAYRVSDEFVLCKPGSVANLEKQIRVIHEKNERVSKDMISRAKLHHHIHHNPDGSPAALSFLDTKIDENYDNLLVQPSLDGQEILNNLTAERALKMNRDLLNMAEIKRGERHGKDDQRQLQEAETIRQEAEELAKVKRTEIEALEKKKRELDASIEARVADALNQANSSPVSTTSLPTEQYPENLSPVDKNDFSINAETDSSIENTEQSPVNDLVEETSQSNDLAEYSPAHDFNLSQSAESSHEVDVEEQPGPTEDIVSEPGTDVVDNSSQRDSSALLPLDPIESAV